MDIGRARAQVERADAERSRFIRQSFSRDPAVASDYDLVVNTGTFSLEKAARIVLEAYGEKFERTIPGSPKIR
jgi:cytidylate kinase